MPDQDLVPRQRARTLSERELLLAAVLCFDLDDSPVAIERLKRQIRSRAAIWPQLVDFANKELLAPTLWAALARKGVTGEVPTDSAGRLASEVTGEWMYVFKPAVEGRIIYVKIVLREDCVIVSFHEDEAVDDEEG